MKTIVGVFFQDQDSLGFAEDSKIGTRVTVSEQTMQYLFKGVIHTPSPLNSSAGIMSDKYGHSAIFRFVETEKTLSFEKWYLNRKDSILYQFNKKKGDVWIGTYCGSQVGKGFARCLVTEIPSDTERELLSLEME